MSIKPGYSGQQFQAGGARARRAGCALRCRSRCPIQVDGGVNDDNIKQLYDEGATLLVAASAIFGREDLPRAYRRLVQQLA